MKKIMTFIIQISLLATMLIQPTLVKAEESVTINSDNFPDPAMLQFAQNQDDSPKDGALSIKEREAVETISLSRTGISNFKGIEYFYNATSLSASNHRATAINLIKNTKLINISLQFPELGTGLTSLDVSMCPDLDSLLISGNKISSLDVGYNKKLTKLLVSNNPIGSLNIENNILLDELQAANCEISSLTLTNNTQLKKLNIPKNNLTSLDLSKNTALKFLSFSSNMIKSINLTNNTALTELYGSNNYLSDIKISNDTINNLTDLGFNAQTNINVTLEKNNSTNQYESVVMNDSIFSANTTFRGISFNNSTKKFTVPNKAVTSATFTNNVNGSSKLRILGTITFSYSEDKTALRTELGLVESTKLTNAYTNASESSKAAYDSAIIEAQNILDKNNATAAEIANATNALSAARLALDGDKIFNPSLIDSIVSVSKNPKLVYVTGEKFDPSGIKLIVNDTKGNTKEVTYSEFESLGLALVGVTDKQVLKFKDDNTIIKVQLKEQEPVTLSKNLRVDEADKAALQAEHDLKDTTKASHVYFNESQDKKDEYDNWLSKAEQALAGVDYTQAEVNNILSNLTAAREALNGGQVDKELLKDELDLENDTLNSHLYFNASSDSLREEYKTALVNAKAVYNNPVSSQAQIDAALSDLTKARTDLDGSEVDKAPLENKKAEAEPIKLTALYLYASQDKKEAFNEALEKAKQVLDNPVSSQVQVNAALNVLTNALSELDGKLESSSIQEEIDKAPAVKDSDKYKFADASKKQAYEDALENAKRILSEPTTTQAQLDEAKDALEKARNDLNGVAPSSPSQSNPAPAPIPQAPAGRTCQDDGYPAGYYWSDSAQACITDYVPTPKPVVTTPQNKPATTPKPTETPTPTPTPTSDTTNEANKKKLEDELSKEVSVLGSDAFKNASADAQKAYQDALSNAKEVLSNKNATQAQVDDALSKLNTATPKEQEKAVEVTPSQETPSSRDFSIANILFMIISSIIALLAASKANFKGISKAIVTLLAIASIAAVVLTTSFNTMTIFNGYSLALGAITAISAIVYLISNKQED